MKKWIKGQVKLFSTVILLAIFTLTLTVGCQKQKPEPSHKLKVVTTVAPITNIVKNIGGVKIDLYGIIPQGMDSHTFEPKASDSRWLAKADLVVLNGLNLEVPIKKLAEANMKTDATILELGNKTISRKEWKFDFSFPKEKGDPNPHLWPNIPYAKNYARLVKDTLVELDPSNKVYYENNANKYFSLLDDLDRRTKKAIATIAPKNRKLLTYHDSWAYFAEHYGMKVIGAIQPADFSEPSPKEVANLIDQIKKEQVPAIFSSEVYSSKVMERIAEETGVKYISTLSDDALPGKPGDRRHSYVGMMVENIKTMAVALGGSGKALDGLDPADTYLKNK